jgi:cytoskeletal protein CcmA (bactofilin family)
MRNRGADLPPLISTQPLSDELIDQISGSDARIGDPKPTLSIESNSIFNGQVLVRGNFEVAGELRVGGALNLPGITVSGTSNFDQIQANSLAISGDTNVQGQMVIEQNLTVTGSGTFGGPVSAPTIIVQNLQINSDLQINRHIDAGGNTPTRSNGNALGSGGTTSVNGTDTAGTVNINVGSGSIPTNGCFVTVFFAQQFNGTPHVVITPVGSQGAALNYYIVRNTASFSICATNANTVANRSFSFDYIAID